MAWLKWRVQNSSSHLNQLELQFNAIHFVDFTERDYTVYLGACYVCVCASVCV